VRSKESITSHPQTRRFRWCAVNVFKPFKPFKGLYHILQCSHCKKYHGYNITSSLTITPGVIFWPHKSATQDKNGYRIKFFSDFSHRYSVLMYLSIQDYYIFVLIQWDNMPEYSLLEINNNIKFELSGVRFIWFALLKYLYYTLPAACRRLQIRDILYIVYIIMNEGGKQ